MENQINKLKLNAIFYGFDMDSSLYERLHNPVTKFRIETNCLARSTKDCAESVSKFTAALNSIFPESMDG